MSHFIILNMGRVNVTYNHVNQCRMFNVRKRYDLFIMTVVFKQIVLLSERQNHIKYILFFWPSKFKNDSTP